MIVLFPIRDLASRHICTESESKVANLCNLPCLKPSTEPKTLVWTPPYRSKIATRPETSCWDSNYSHSGWECFLFSSLGYLCCSKLTALCEAEQHEDRQDRGYMSYILDDIERFFPVLSTFPPDKHYTTTSNRSGRSIWIFMELFTCYSWA